MSDPFAVARIKFDLGRDKDSIETRLQRGVKVKSQALQSPLYQSLEIKTGVDAVVADTAALEAGTANLAAISAAYEKARTGLGMLRNSWDRSYDLLLAAGEKHCTTVDEGTGLGLVVRPRTRHPFAMPTAVAVRRDLRRDLLRIHVDRAPGNRAVCVQVRRPGDPEDTWTELVGWGAMHRIEHPAKGIWKVRAATRGAAQMSDFTTPVSVIVT